MLLALSRASAFALAGIVTLGSGALVMQRARRVARENTALLDGAASRRYVWKVDVQARRDPLPSRFNRASGGAPLPLADELKAVQLPPGPEAIGLQHRRRAAELALGAGGAPTAPADPAAVDEGVQEALPIFGPPGSDVDTGVPIEAKNANAVNEQVEQAPGSDAPAVAELPPLTVSWQAAETPAGAEPPDEDPAPDSDAPDGVPDHATLVRQYIQALRRKIT